MTFYFRKATLDDVESITELYWSIAEIPGGFARLRSEIDHKYVQQALLKATSVGLAVLAVDANENARIGASILAYRLGPNVFSHVLSELTIGVHPDVQGLGLGRKIFMYFLEEIEKNMPDIKRVELVARESNHKAIHLYESLGFVKEGRFEQRIQSVHGGFEADIPMAWLNPKYKN